MFNTTARSRGALLTLATTLTLAAVPAAGHAAVPALSSVTLSAETVVGGTPVTGRVTLTATAPTGGVVVALSSYDTSAATVPAGVTVPAGARSADFPVTTYPVPNPRSAIIVGTAGGVTAYDIVTVTTGSQANRGSVSLSRGGAGGGRVTSRPAGIDCTFTPTTTSGTCGNAFFPAGTEVRLEARPAEGSRFEGWEFEVSCPDAPEVTISAGVAHICRPVFVRR